MSTELTEAERVNQLAHAIYATGALNLPLSDRIDEDCHDAARAVIGSGWVSPEEAKAREAAARREALLEAAEKHRVEAEEVDRAAWHFVRRAHEAEAKVARVEALAEKWDRPSMVGIASGIRAALAEPERDEEGR